MDDNFIYIDGEEKPKDEIFGNLTLCDEARKNREINQEKRIKQLDELIKEARKIVTKYLCVLNTDDEEYIDEFLRKELIDLIVYKEVPNSHANNIVDVAGFLIYAMSLVLHDYKDITVAI